MMKNLKFEKIKSQKSERERERERVESKMMTPTMTSTDEEIENTENENVVKTPKLDEFKFSSHTMSLMKTATYVFDF